MLAPFFTLENFIPLETTIVFLFACPLLLISTVSPFLVSNPGTTLRTRIFGPAKSAIMQGRSPLGISSRLSCWMISFLSS